MSLTQSFLLSMRSRSGIAHSLAMVFFMTVLSGCGGYMANREGNALMAEGKFDEGLAKLEEAAKLEPKNAEYRIGFITTRASLVNSLLASAEAALRDGRISDAEKIYRQVRVYDPVNSMATQGLEAIAMARRHKQAMAEAESLFKKGGAANLAEALEKLRPIISENPGQKEALNLKARIDEARAKEKTVEIKLAAAYRKPISLEFRDAPLKSVFDLIAKVSGLNFFFDKDLRPDLKATILAKNTSTEDAIRLLLVTNQLEQKILNDNSILVYPNTPQKLKEYQTLSLRTFYLANADVKAVANTIKTLLKTKDMVIDERLGIIIMRDTPEVIRMAERLVALQDLADPEVMLEVEVLEIKRSRLLELGINWPSHLTLAPLATVGVPLTVDDLLGLNRTKIQASIGNIAINARKEDQNSNILANPRIRVRNKDKAKIMIGDRVPVITTTSTSTGFVSESVSYIDVGLKLEVEPNIYLDGEVAIKITLEVSSLVREILSKSGSLSYQIGTRNATTVLRLKDGETQILAGLISDEERSTANKVPALGELPVLGRLFGSQKDDTTRSEIILSITPRMMRSIRRPDLVMAEFDSGTEASIGSRNLTVGATEADAMGDIKADAKPVQPRQPGQGQTGGAAPHPAAPTGVSSDASVTTPSATPAATGGPIAFAWQGPAQVRVGDQFSAVLQVTSQDPVRGVPVMIGFDPQLLQVVSVQEGNFLKQGGGQTTFSERIDPVQGKVFIAAVLQNTNGSDNGINGTGSVATVNFKAVKAAPATRIQLLSASPEPQPAMQVVLPVEQTIKITQ